MSAPLDGLRVLDLTRYLAGPFCTMMLGDYGADIVKVEAREGREFRDAEGKDSYFFLSANRGKRSLTLDLRKPEGKAVLLRLLERADELVENFRPGVMERLGLGPADVYARNPRLVFARMTGWGQDGPLAQAAGHDINYIAITGALAAVGKPGETATPPQNLVGDFGGGSMYCAMGILAALYERERSGKGQVVDAAIVDGATSLMSFFFGVRHVPHLSTERGKGMLGGATHFYRCYECSDGREISLGAIEPQFYAELLDKADAPDELRQGQMDPANWEDYAAKMSALIKTKTQAEWCDILEGSDACFGPVLSVDEARDHPHMKAREAYVERDGMWHTAPAPRFSRTPGIIRDSAMDGAQTVESWATGG